jgi:hypothetical protein
MKIISISFVSIFALVLLTGCFESNSHYFKRIAEYGTPRNELRVQKSIPAIPSNWVVRADRSAVAWDNPDFKSGKKVPMHQYKFLTFTDVDSGTVRGETDHYQSGKQWNDPDAGTMHEYVDITYSFELESQGKSPWKAEVLEEGHGPKSISLSDAEQILEKWGIDRHTQIK